MTIQNLPQSLSKHFDLHLSTANCMSEIIEGIIKAKSPQIHKIAEEFSNVNIEVESHRRRIQRFLQNNTLCNRTVARFIAKLFIKKEKLLIAIDRTNWEFGKTIHNLLTLAIIVKNTAVPLFMVHLDHPGNSDTEQRIELMQKFLDTFGSECLECVTADREFIGEDWIEWLCKNNILFVIRSRSNIAFRHQNGGKMLCGNFFEKNCEEEKSFKTKIKNNPIILTGKYIPIKRNSYEKQVEKCKKVLVSISKEFSNMEDKNKLDSILKILAQASKDLDKAVPKIDDQISDPLELFMKELAKKLSHLFNVAILEFNKNPYEIYRSLNFELLAVMSSPEIENPLEVYRKRWGIECLFRGMKRHGFNMEDSHIKVKEHFETLSQLLCIAFAIAVSVGLIMNEIKEIPYRKTVKSRLLSIPRYGMDFIRRTFKNSKRSIIIQIADLSWKFTILGIFIE